MAKTAWPKIRLHLRAVTTTTMIIGWTLSAASGLLPYFFIGSGPGSGAATVLGVAKSTWTSIHLWSSLGMVVFTLTHVVLNRRGVTRAVKVVSGSDLRRTAEPSTPGPRRRRFRGLGWVAVLMVVAVLGIGGVVFATDHGTGSDATESAQNGQVVMIDDGSATGVQPVDGSAVDGTGLGGGHRGGG